MSTEIETKDNAGYYLTRFYGGTERGMSYQITEEGTGRYVQFTRLQIKDLVRTLSEWFEYEKEHEGRR